MAKVVFSGLEPRIADQLAQLLAVDGHEIQRQKNTAPIKHVLGADVVFASGEPVQYLSLLRRVRAINGSLCFVVIARFPVLTGWLEAIEAGATDYWSTPFVLLQVRSLVASATSRRIAAAATAGR